MLFSWEGERWLILLVQGSVSDSLPPHGLWPARFLCPWNFADKNTGVNCDAFLQGSSWPRGRTLVSCIAGRLFTIWTTREALINSNRQAPDLKIQSAGNRKNHHHKWKITAKGNLIILFQALFSYSFVCLCLFFFLAPVTVCRVVAGTKGLSKKRSQKNLPLRKLYQWLHCSCSWKRCQRFSCSSWVPWSLEGCQFAGKGENILVWEIHASSSKKGCLNL